MLQRQDMMTSEVKPVDNTERIDEGKLLRKVRPDVRRRSKNGLRMVDGELTEVRNGTDSEMHIARLWWLA